MVVAEVRVMTVKEVREWSERVEESDGSADQRKSARASASIESTAAAIRCTQQQRISAPRRTAPHIPVRR